MFKIQRRGLLEGVHVRGEVLQVCQELPEERRAVQVLFNAVCMYYHY